MKPLRIIGAVGALALMFGEIYRSWGVGRPVMFVLDDVFAGLMMLSAAWLVGRETVARRAYFSAAWGVAVGMLYGSFFGKLIEPARAEAGNFGVGTLTVLLGVAFVLAVGGLVASLVLPVRGRSTIEHTSGD